MSSVRHVGIPASLRRVSEDPSGPQRGSKSPRRLSVAGWQVIDEGGRVRVLLAGAANVDATVTAGSVREALERVGARDVPVVVNLVDAIPRTALGKAPLIRRAQLATTAH